ncbi:hypothetical protein FCM35_KLT20752 [Carex littledalei]|uniref:Uncharacterized protein n=1 Tax=Carex littledalei TaxID=544730 RepID=A0A833RGA8_9POAL|nr:hypothetical protein FCM35_KLT20752 [Carex littledalei]
MKPLKQSEINRNGHIRRDEMTRITASSRSIMEYDKWIEGIKSSGAQFGKPGSPSPGAWSSRILPSSNFKQSNSDEEFQCRDKRDDPDADRAASPVLWKKSPADESSDMLQNSESAYPATRTQEIANYRKEMMEMVRGLPDVEFELTLQDIVEKRKEFKEVEPVTVKELASDEKETKRKKKQKKYVKSKNVDTGLLTRMFLPLSVAVRRKSFNLRNRGDKVATKEVDEKKQVMAKKKSKDEEWWRKNEFSEKGSSSSSSVGSSSSNGSNSSGDDHFSRNMSMKKTKCYCFRPGKSKAKSS